MGTEIYAGTSGYSYKEWRGAFYPEDLPQDEWLSYYARQLPTVEINNTFYRMPKTHVVEGWRDAVPDNFRFVFKASRRITHQKRLKEADEPMEYLVKRAHTFGDKLGAVLFQLPPNMPLNLERLQTFQALIPAEIPAAFEFRNASWDDPAVSEALAQHGHARVVSHGDDEPLTDVPAGALVYLRLRASRYTPQALRKWHARVLASGAKQAYVFFKHEDAGAGPALAKKFLGLPSASEPARATRAAKGAKPAARRSRTAAQKKPASKAS